MVQTPHICSSGTDLGLLDPKRCGRPAKFIVAFKVSKAELYACGPACQRSFNAVLSGLEWKALEEAPVDRHAHPD